jgi:general secretion pathway protein G
MRQAPPKAAQAFTLVEIMIVVAIIGIMIAVAVPSWLKARSRAQGKACMESQEQMSHAIGRWAIDLGKQNGEKPEFSDLIGADLYIKRTPICPIDGDDDGHPDPIPISAVGVPVLCPQSPIPATHLFTN